MKKVTVSIIIDALRHDFITKKDSPFLFSLKNYSIYGDIEESFGFIGRPATFAGLYPATSGISFMYCYEPQKSPYKIVKYIPRFLSNTFLINKLARKLITKWANVVYSYEKLSYSFDTYNIPLNILPYFNLVEQLSPWNPNYLPQTTLFDLLRENNIKWLFIGYPGSNQKTFAIWNKFQKEISPDISFIWLHFAETDWAEHEFGPMSDERKEKLKEIDETIKKIWSKLNNMFDEVNMLVFGDHGAVEVKKRVNIESKLKSLDLKVGKDYIYFLDSTMARFWFKNDAAQLKITEMLKELTDGNILTKQDFIKYRANFNHTKYGELIWVANEGVLIMPNFWQGNSPVKGIHGYLPDVNDNQAAFVLSSPKINGVSKLKKPCEMVDIFPTILDLMGLPIPESNEGMSILKRIREVQL